VKTTNEEVGFFMKKSIGITLLSAVMLLTSSCGQSSQSKQRAPGQQSAQMNQYTSHTASERTNRTLTEENKNMKDLQKTADSIANGTVRTPKVKKASIVIYGAKAYVGITLADTVRSRQEASKVKEQVRLRVQQKMPGYAVRVSSDPVIFARIQDISDGVRSGTPINNYRMMIKDLETRTK
jgi:YhcN/YlaJ family sporulation lipoprotein